MDLKSGLVEYIERTDEEMAKTLESRLETKDLGSRGVDVITFALGALRIVGFQKTAMVLDNYWAYGKKN